VELYQLAAAGRSSTPVAPKMTAQINQIIEIS